MSKAKAKHAVIGPILRCGPIPAALKRLVWCAVVRSRLEYGAEVVTLNEELTKSLEGVPHMGVTTILRINPLRPDGKRHALPHRALRPCHEDVRGNGRGEVLLRLRSRPHPALPGWSGSAP